ncbi:hypothetical protein [Actinophytocola sp.]|uniref:hypothetical protein n=1 Tax=Actinophytocola sp. TaxID=1872138 RepID=UPI002EDB11F1
MTAFEDLPTAVRSPAGMAGVAALTAAVTIAGLWVGGWWPTVVIAAVVTVMWAGKRACVAMLGGTVVAWVALGFWQSGSRVLDVADLVGELALDQRGLRWVVVALTVLYAAVLALAGAWVGGAVRRLVVASRVNRDAVAVPASEVADVGDEIAGDRKEAEHV